MLEHPVITRLLATGQPQRTRRWDRICCDCGGAVMQGSYYRVAGGIFCEGCMKLRREEVIL